MTFAKGIKYLPRPGAQIAPAENSMPPLRTRARNAAKAASKIVASIAKGEPVLVDDATAEKRIAICRACPSNFFEPKLERCKSPKCGCFLRVKRWFSPLPCPEGHWEGAQK